MQIRSTHRSVLFFVLLNVGIAVAATQAPPPPPGGGAPGGQRGGGPGMGGPALTITTSAWPDGGQIPTKYTMAAGPSAVSPALEWTNVPSGTAAFVLILHDPDVALKKTTEDVLHWMLVNIPGNATKLPEGAAKGATLEDGTMQMKNVMGQNAYVGPGAPAGPFHHYTIELFALDKKLEVPPDATRADVLKAMDGHILGKAAYVGLFHR